MIGCVGLGWGSSGVWSIGGMEHGVGYGRGEMGCVHGMGWCMDGVG